MKSVFWRSVTLLWSMDFESMELLPSFPDDISISPDCMALRKALGISGCAFSISSTTTMEKSPASYPEIRGWSVHFSLAFLYPACTRISDIMGVSPYPTYPAPDPVSFSILLGCGILSPDIFSIPFESPRSIRASDRANSVFPTPVGPPRNTDQSAPCSR